MTNRESNEFVSSNVSQSELERDGHPRLVWLVIVRDRGYYKIEKRKRRERRGQRKTADRAAVERDESKMRAPLLLLGGIVVLSLAVARALSCVCSPLECDVLTDEDCPGGLTWDPCRYRLRLPTTPPGGRSKQSAARYRRASRNVAICARFLFPRKNLYPRQDIATETRV